MLLACDIGNSSVKLAIFDKDKRISFGLYPKNEFSASTDILSITTKSNIRLDQFDAVYISSVVPQITDNLVNYVTQNMHIVPTVINNQSNLDITIDRDFKESIGSDILVMSSYAYRRCLDAVLVISAGTATVFSYINKEGVLKGCAIAPGFKTFSTSLTEKSTLLPPFVPKYQYNHLATNTIDAMSIGSFNGYIEMINSIVANIIKEIEFEPIIILCGGHSSKIKEYLKNIDYQEADFVISGLNHLYLKK